MAMRLSLAPSRGPVHFNVLETELCLHTAGQNKENSNRRHTIAPAKTRQSLAPRPSTGGLVINAVGGL